MIHSQIEAVWIDALPLNHLFRFPYPAIPLLWLLRWQGCSLQGPIVPCRRLSFIFSTRTNYIKCQDIVDEKESQH